jgi:hypothetical protein
LRLQNLRMHVKQQLGEGAAVVARETGRQLPSIAHHYWQDEKVAVFGREMLRVKKLLFLAVLAVEYEHQVSLGAREQVVAAVTPTRIKEILELLQSVHGTNQLHGVLPQHVKVTRSLRNDILGASYKLANGKNFGEMEFNYRLRDRLTSPASALYDNDGNYLGQAIQFTLKPEDVPEFRYTYGERGWSVGVTVAGGYLSADASGNVMLLKRNLAYSKWFPTDEKHSTAYQVGRIRPAGYLYDVDGRVAQTIKPEQERAFVATLLQPLFNVPMLTVESSEGPLSGSSDVFAGRGLYGDYILLFPAQKPTDSHYIDLKQVEDVVLRFDGYAASKAPPIN